MQPMRPAAIFALLLAAAPAWAQQPVSAPEPLDPRKNQKIERIRIEDAGSRVDELRVGGQTQSITVQPAGDMPAYEMQPSDLARTRPADRRDGMSSGTPRVWNLLNF
jgi:hypothetical protein